jgi:hypothetical protein
MYMKEIGGQDSGVDGRMIVANYPGGLDLENYDKFTMLMLL